MSGNTAVYYKNNDRRFSGFPIIRIILCVFLFAHVNSSLLSEELDIAWKYFQQAEKYFNDGNILESEKLLFNSLEYYPDFSESYFLLSRIYLRNQESTLLGLDNLNAAIKADTWIKTDPQSVYGKQASIYLQIKEYEVAKRILADLLNKGAEDPVIYSLFADVLFATGETIALENFLKDTIKRFPDMPGFYVLLSDYAVRKGNTEWAMDVIDKGLEQLPDNQVLILEKIKLTTDKDDINKIIGTYILKGGKDPIAAVIALENKLENKQEFIDFFIKNNGMFHIDLLDRFISVNGLKEILEDLPGTDFLNFTGVRILDVNRDGFFEEKYHYKNGRLASWDNDKNQDGVIEFKAVFNNNIPVSVLFQNEQLQIQAIYKTYPFLSLISFITETARKEYKLLPLKYSLKIFDDLSFKDDSKLAGQYRLFAVRNLSFPDEAAVKDVSFCVNEYENNILTQRIEILGGKKVYLKSDEDKDGVFDHFINFDKNLPATGKRDLDGDGIFEIEEYYEKGKLKKIIYNADKDDYPDCVQYFSDDMRITDITWDYNNDGITDAKQLTKKKTTEYFYSSSYNGFFDLNVVFSGDKLISVKKNNKVIAVYPGKQAFVFWIGEKGIMPDIDLQDLPGIYKVKGHIYFIFRYKKNLYIEVLK